MAKKPVELGRLSYEVSPAALKTIVETIKVHYI